MILLLCMTVGIFSACTGDDGEAGPQGPPGPQGPAGDPGDIDQEISYTYSFLKTWGSQTGTVTCSDPMFKGMGMFPGPEMLDPMPDNNNDGSPDIDIFEAQCGTGADASATSALFVSVDSVKVGSATLRAADLANFAAAELVFVKTGQAKDGPSDPVEVASTETRKAASVVTTKLFAGGPVFANLSTTGGNVEALQRIDLHSNCAVGTAPSMIEGNWRAVRIIENARTFDTNKDRIGLDTGGLIKTTTTKVCVRLDSIPGTVKCFVEKGKETSSGGTESAPTFGDPTMVSQQIALYDGMAMPDMMLTAVKPTAHKTTKLLPPTTEATDNTDGTELATVNAGNEAQNLFGASTDSNNVLSTFDTSKLCNLFEEGLE